MPRFSDISKKRLLTCHPSLQAVCAEAIKLTDFTIVCGHRGQKEQDLAVAQGLSKTPWPTSKHNQTPSLAVDVAPYPIDWTNRPRFLALAKTILGVGARLGIRLRWGGDFDRDGRTDDEKFVDLPHIELDGGDQ